jgi:hypothetical protein
MTFDEGFCLFNILATCLAAAIGGLDGWVTVFAMNAVLCQIRLSR